VCDRPDVDVPPRWIVVRPSCHGPSWVIGTASAGSYLRPEVVEGESIISASWVGVPTGAHDGALVGSGVFLVGGGFLWPRREVFQGPFWVDRVLPVVAVLGSPSERWFTKLLQVRMPLLMSDGGARRMAVLLHTYGRVGKQLEAEGVAGGLEDRSTPGRLWDTLEPVGDVAGGDVGRGGSCHEQGGADFWEVDRVHPGGVRNVAGVVGDVAEGSGARHVCMGIVL